MWVTLLLLLHSQNPLEMWATLCVSICGRWVLDFTCWRVQSNQWTRGSWRVETACNCNNRSGGHLWASSVVGKSVLYLSDTMGHKSEEFHLPLEIALLWCFVFEKLFIFLMAENGEGIRIRIRLQKHSFAVVIARSLRRIVCCRFPFRCSFKGKWEAGKSGAAGRSG